MRQDEDAIKAAGRGYAAGGGALWRAWHRQMLLLYLLLPHLCTPHSSLAMFRLSGGLLKPQVNFTTALVPRSFFASPAAEALKAPERGIFPELRCTGSGSPGAREPLEPVAAGGSGGIWPAGGGGRSFDNDLPQ